ncbi:MAG: FtsX-like permease family protein [Candidatus Gracilibacteria bacterium]|nr:FtsX-like permease family protein [Candidatus Gracilibacteria bacterium]
MKKFTSVRVGFFLAYRQVIRGSLWTNTLIISVMFLTFLNLVVVSGILVGLIQGSSQESQLKYSGDIIISNLPTKNYIENSQRIMSTLETIPEIEAFTSRYLEGGTIQANYKEKTNNAERQDEAGTQIAGIDPRKENLVTNISGEMFEGEFLRSDEENFIVLGSSLLKEYARGEAPGFDTLEKVRVGDKVRVKVGNSSKEFTIKGILKSKEGNLDRRAFIIDRELRKLIGRSDFNVDEIAIKLKDIPGITAHGFKNSLQNLNFEEFATIQTYKEAQGQFLEDIAFTFGVLGNVIGSIGLAVASITIFIIIFINAITRRKYIGILKGIGIQGIAIELSYVFQSLFYAIIGTTLGVLVIYFFLIPYIDLNPIDFPFSDGILYAPAEDTAIKAAILLCTTMIAGYIPAKMIIRRNTLDAILGR